ncbi:MAG: hypothetical protein AB8H03_03680 [Saprospiraceae bacterium]
MNPLQPIIHRMISNPKLMFLIDGLGAVLSVFLLGVVLVQLENLIGMPSKTLYVLAGIAGFFVVFSFFCAFRIKKNWRLFLKVIAFFNLSYCLLTFSLVLFHQAHLTTLGVGYFLLEIIIIVSLSIFEFKVATSELG